MGEADVLGYVREVWPTAYREGSTGSERSWWIRTDGQEAVLVAHSFPVRGRDDTEMWVRRLDAPKP